MDRPNTTPSARLRSLVLALTGAGLLASCAAPEQAPLSPVADPNAPMRVSTARVTTEPPDPVGRLFNDGPRRVVTYSVNTDPLAVLFRDPAFIVKLSPTPAAEPATEPTPQAAVPASGPPAPMPVRVVPEQVAQPPGTTKAEPVAQKPVTEPTMPAVASSTPASPPAPPAEQREEVAVTTMATAQAPEPKPAASVQSDASPVTTTATTEPASTAATDTVAPVVVAAAAATAPPKEPDTATTNEPIVLAGLKQKSAGWPIATKPANIFGAQGPDGSAWRGLVYKSPANTPVKAIEPGKVVFAQPLRSYGNVIIIDHGKDYTSIYGYNKALTKKVGDTVRKGETVALVGDTGPLADEALYFEIRKDSIPINPSIYLATNP